MLEAVATLDTSESEDRFAGVVLFGAGPGRFAKNPAMLCCFVPGLPLLELVLFFRVAGAFGVTIELALF